MVKSSEIFNLENSKFKKILEDKIYPQEVLPLIHDYISELGNSLDLNEYDKVQNNIWIHKSAIVSKTAEIIGPAIVMENSEIRHNSYLRENVIVGPNSVVGNSSEIKNSILLSHVQVPHFNYVGDSILGNNVHLGAGVILSNLRLDKQNVRIDHQDTGLRKIGAFVGDGVQIGCNSVICPGTIIYPDVNILPLTVVKGIVKENKEEIKIVRL